MVRMDFRAKDSDECDPNGLQRKLVAQLCRLTKHLNRRLAATTLDNSKQ